MSLAKIAVDQCDVPPQGWACTRQKGHAGPCAAIQDSYLALLPETALNEDLLKDLGFEFVDHDDDPPYESWKKNEITVWDFNGLYWIVDALDQAGIGMEFHNLGQLDLFFRACGKEPLLTLE